MNQVEEDECLIPALEEESIEVEYLLVEPKHDHAYVDGVLRSGEQDLEKGTKVKGGLDFNTMQEGGDKLKFEVLNVVPHDVDEEENIKAANSIPCTFEDYLLDFEFPECVPKMDYTSSGELHLEISVSESLIPGFSESDNSVLGMSEPLTTIPEPKCQNNLLDRGNCKLHRVFSSQCGCETHVEDKLWLEHPTLSELQAVEKLENVANLLDEGSSFGKNNKATAFPSSLTSGRMYYNSAILQKNELVPVGQGIGKDIIAPRGVFKRSSAKECSSDAPSSQTPGRMCYSSSILQKNELDPVGQGIGKDIIAPRGVLKRSSAKECSSDAPLSPKRMRKPPRRYIEESSDLSSCTRRQRSLSSSSSKKLSGVTCHKKHQVVGLKAKNSVRNEPIGKVCIPVPFGSPVRSEDQNELVSITGFASDEEPSSPAVSEDDTGTTLRRLHKSGCRRKHHTVWSLMEVRKLIDGVSQYGVGRWTVIKKLLFSSSAHRTPVDLKDKWRNLLRASCVQMQSKRGEDERKKKHAWRPLPKSVLHQVRELALVYPYPRDQRSNLPRVHQLSVPARLVKSRGHGGGAPSGSNERNTCRKSCT